MKILPGWDGIVGVEKSVVTKTDAEKKNKTKKTKQKDKKVNLIELLSNQEPIINITLLYFYTSIWRNDQRNDSFLRQKKISIFVYFQQ